MPEPNEFKRVPGYFPRWDLQQIVQPGLEFHIESAGETADGTALFAVYSRPPRDGRVP